VSHDNCIFTFILEPCSSDGPFGPSLQSRQISGYYYDISFGVLSWNEEGSLVKVIDFSGTCPIRHFDLIRAYILKFDRHEIPSEMILNETESFYFDRPFKERERAVRIDRLEQGTPVESYLSADYPYYLGNSSIEEIRKSGLER